MRSRTALQRLLLLALLVGACMFQRSVASSAGRTIQDQGSSPYCLFAVNAYLSGGDMWQLSAEYYRRHLPTLDGLVPVNSQVLKLAGTLYGVRWSVAPQHDWQAARQAVRDGHPSAFSGQGHAIIVVAFENGRAFYLDSLHPDTMHSMTESELRKWWDGWAWYKAR